MTLQTPYGAVRALLVLVLLAPLASADNSSTPLPGGQLLVQTAGGPDCESNSVAYEMVWIDTSPDGAHRVQAQYYHRCDDRPEWNFEQHTTRASVWCWDSGTACGYGDVRYHDETYNGVESCVINHEVRSAVMNTGWQTNPCPAGEVHHPFVVLLLP